MLDALIAAVGIVLTALLGVIGRLLWLKLEEVLTKVNAVDEKQDSTQIRVVRIESQVFNNGGTSLRDAIDRTEHRLTDHLVEAAADRAQLHAHMQACAMMATRRL